jgi:hypothetical protein
VFRTPVEILRQWRRSRRYNSADPAVLDQIFGERKARLAQEHMTEAELLGEAQKAAYLVADLIDRAASVCPNEKTAMFYTIVAALCRGELDEDLICLLRFSRGETTEITPRAEFLYATIGSLSRGEFSDDLIRFINGAKPGLGSPAVASAAVVNPARPRRSIAQAPVTVQRLYARALAASLVG